MTFTSINPSNGIKIATYPSHSPEEARKIIDNCKASQQKWSETGFSERSNLMDKAAGILLDEKETLAKLITEEMGKPIAQSRAEIEKCSNVCTYYARNSQKFLSAHKVETEYSDSYISFQPLGVILAIMPWNFPFWQVFRFAAPALMAGNGAVLKHASNVMGCSLAIESIFRKAGFPQGLFSSLLIGSSTVSSIIENPAIQGVTLTGSVGAGKAVAAKAGEMLKKTVLELGGSDPYIVLEDADLDMAAENCVNSRLINNGQSCIAAKRFIIVDNVFDEFLNRFKNLMEQKTMSDPMDENSDLGPQASVDLRNELHQQVEECIRQGAECILGGKIPQKPGAWYPPSILTGVKPGMPAWDDELFGPVAAVIRAKDTRDAIRIANDTVFGLGAAIFTGNIEKGRQIAQSQLNAGFCCVNEMVKSDPRMPFGGIGNSGYGRELSWFGIQEFTNIKSVVVK